MLGAVQRDQHAPVQALERRERPGRLDRLEEQPVKRRRRGAIQHPADVVVARDRGHAEQRLAVRPAVALLQRALVRQERRAAHEEKRERRQADIGHREVALARRSLAPVGKTGTDAFQISDQVFKAGHPGSESKVVPRREQDRSN